MRNSLYAGFITVLPDFVMQAGVTKEKSRQPACAKASADR